MKGWILMSYTAEIEAGRAKLGEVSDVDGTVLRIVGKRAGETITYVASRIDGRWYIVGIGAGTGGRAFDSVCAFFSRMIILEAVLYIPNKRLTLE